MKKKNLSSVNIILLVALLLVVGASLYFTLSVPKGPSLKEVEVELLGSDCKDCFDLSPAFDFLNQQGIKVVEINNRSIEESSELAKKYSISRLPALVLTGDVDNLTIPNFERKDDALVFANAPPPYYDVAESRVKGAVSVTYLSVDCDDCFNMSLIVDQLRPSGIFVSSVKEIKSSSDEGKKLISQYKIEKLPSLLFNKDALEYDTIKQAWSTVGSVEGDVLVLRFVNPPYVNASNGKVEGFVELINLVDNSCAECFDSSAYQDLFEQGFGMRFSSVKDVDVSSPRGKLLVKKYGIELIPTAVLSKDASLYPSVAQVWSQAGSQEKDGSYVFRVVPLMENVVPGLVYRNLTNNETLRVQLEEPEIAPVEVES